MKKYEKPQIIKNEFVADESVAVCGDTKVSYAEQTVNCIINGSETIFTDACGTNYASKGQIVSYEGTEYYLWYNGNTSTTNTLNIGGTQGGGTQGGGASFDDTLLKAIQGVAGVSGPGWHAATFSSISSTVSAS